MIENAFQYYAGTLWNSGSQLSSGKVVYLARAKDPTWTVLNGLISWKSNKFHATGLTHGVSCSIYDGTQLKVTLRLGSQEPHKPILDTSSPGYSHIISQDREASWIRKHTCEMSTYIESTGCGLNLRSFSPL